MSEPASARPDDPTAAHVAAVRAFSRFYTREIGILNEGLLESPFSLTQARVLYELANGGEQTAHELRRALDLDAGYLSRILAGFERQALVTRRPAPQDGRQTIFALTEQGRITFDQLDRASADQVRSMLDCLGAEEQRQLVGAMRRIERLWGEACEATVPYVLRPHQVGDMGWIVHRHGVLYAREYGWDETFEALVAEITAQFVRSYDPRRERCWIAEVDGEIVGSVFLVRHSDEVAKLRLLYVEPKARGRGIGRRLVEKCIKAARAIGYRHLVLWTNDVLVAARHIYETAGFRLIEEEPHHSFGKDLVGQTWQLDL
jgi:DNA-binding MarR family transcriptional regulator/N-acetylglutamate synthase-like GNAT family acetyltransferase